MKTAILISFLLTISLYAAPQQLHIQSFDYFRESDPVSGKHWLNTPESGWVRDSIRNAFARAISRRWNISFPDGGMSVKAPGIFTAEPKFTTKLKEKEPGTWYLFLQVFCKRNIAAYFSDNYVNLTTTMQLKCRIISGDNDSIVFDRELTVRQYTLPAPAGQVILTRIPAHPAYIAKAFDSIATWLFQPGEETVKTIRLKPACVYSDNEPSLKPIAHLEFAGDEKSIQLLTEPTFSFNTPGPDYRLIKDKKNIGGNTATGIITLFTGANFSKTKLKFYSADYPFASGEDTIHCIVYYAEQENADRERIKEKGPDGWNSYSIESGEYGFSQRRTDSAFTNVILAGTDTLATFKLKYFAGNNRKSYTALWDGSDTSTRMQMPAEWNNRREEDEVQVSGMAAKEPFMMQTSKEQQVKSFYLNGCHVLTVLGKSRPSVAMMFEQLTVQQLQFFTILASLPYTYFNYP